MEDGINEKFQELKEEGYMEFITFHPSYSYEEFVEGITVHTEKEGKPTEEIRYKLKPGIFKTLCKRALASAIEMKKDVEDRLEWKKHIDRMPWKEIYDAYLKKAKDGRIDFSSAPKYVLIIDEINRGDISKIFGELITLIEKDKRLGEEEELTATLPYSNDTFGVPPNLYLIGTMNTADRSVALMDVALRRRFEHKLMNPDFSILEEEYIEKNKETLQKNGVYNLLIDSKKALDEVINRRICEERTVGRDRQIGHSYLFHVETPSELIMVWQNEILPLLDEYCNGNCDKINKILFDKEEDSKWVNTKEGIVGFENIEDLESFIEEINKSS